MSVPDLDALRIALVNLRGQLELVAPHGRERLIVSDDDRMYQFPTWAPNGQSIAALATSASNGRVLVYDFAEGPLPAPRPLYTSADQPPFYLYWSPNSYYVSFLANHERGGIALHLAQAEGGESSLLGIGQPFFWSWAPDSSQLLMHTNGRELRLMQHPFQYASQQITTVGPFQTPGISPSGRYLAYSGQDKHGDTAVVVSSGAAVPDMRIPHHGSAVLSWSPCRDQLAFISPAEPALRFYGPLRVLDTHTGNVRQLVNRDVLAYFWSPNGRYIAYLTLAEQVQPRFNNEDPPFVAGGYAAGQPVPQPRDSEDVWLELRLLEVDTGQRKLLTLFEPNALFVNQFMPYFDQYALSHPLWSPDSQHLILPVIANRQELIVVMPINGLPPLPVAEGVMATWRQT